MGSEQGFQGTRDDGTVRRERQADPSAVCPSSRNLIPQPTTFGATNRQLAPRATAPRQGRERGRWRAGRRRSNECAPFGIASIPYRIDTKCAEGIIQRRGNGCPRSLNEAELENWLTGRSRRDAPRWRRWRKRVTALPDPPVAWMTNGRGISERALGVTYFARK
jgi:hypothetical protein